MEVSAGVGQKVVLFPLGRGPGCVTYLPVFTAKEGV